MVMVAQGCEQHPARPDGAVDVDRPPAIPGNVVEHPGGRWRLTLDPSRFWQRVGSESLHPTSDQERLFDEPHSGDDFALGVRVVGSRVAGAPDYRIQIVELTDAIAPIDLVLGDVRHFQRLGLDVTLDTLLHGGVTLRHHQRGPNEHVYLRERLGFSVIVRSSTTSDDDTVRGDVVSILAGFEVR